MWKALLCASFFISSWSTYAQNLPAEVEKALQGKLNISSEELAQIRIRDERESKLSNLRHYYLEEHLGDVPVFSSFLSLHVNEDGQTVFFNDQRVLKDLEEVQIDAIKGFDSQGFISVSPARLKTLLDVEEPPLVHQERTVWWLDRTLQLATELIVESKEELRQLVVRAEDQQVVHNRLLTVSCHAEDIAGSTGFDLNSSIPSANGKTSSFLPSFAGQYRYFPAEDPSPTYGSRVLETGLDLINSSAAPHGWHDGDGNSATIEYAYTQGNHVYAYYAPVGTISEPPPLPIIRDPITDAYLSGNVPAPAGNSLNFDYNSDLSSSEPTDYLEDAITNLFVWNNLAHDYLYVHGFDEAAGNFQELDFSGGSNGGDPVWARAQDGTGVNNASFNTPPDGSNPTMRMFLWNASGNTRDVSFDNVIIAHEYAHGLSFRLVGGPDNVSCLSNFEQGGEGWSDFIGMLLTLKDTDGNGTVEESTLGEGIRSIGNYLLGQDRDGTGIRSRFYSTDMDCPSLTCNDVTYDQLPQLQAPHGVGMLWATMLWDMCWALINEHGFEPDLSNSGSTAGNIRALRIVIEALKMTACEPSFVDMRDAVLAANQSLYGTTDSDLLWTVFARRGLGVDAQDGGTASYDTPTAHITKTVDKIRAEVGETVVYTLTVENNSAQSLTQVRITDDIAPQLSVQPSQISDGGSLFGNTIVWPAVSLSAGGSLVRTFSGQIIAMDGSSTSFNDPVEGLSGAFTPLGSWILDGGQANPATGSTLAWFHPSLPLPAESSLVLNVQVTAPHDHLVFWQWYDLESGIDGGVIEILNGSNWIDLGSNIIEHPYSGFLYDALPNPLAPPVPLTTLSGRSGYTGYSGGWQRTVIDLSSYSGNQTIRVRYAADESTDTDSCPGPGSACGGWYLDDFYLLDLHAIPNEACVRSAEEFGSCDDIGMVGTIYYPSGALPVEWLDVAATSMDDHILIHWEVREDGENQGFWLERKSTDEDNFSALAWIPAESLTNGSVTDYNYADYQVRPGETYFYRLRQEDFDGQYSYSPIVSGRLSLEQNFSWRILPNPGTDRLLVDLPSVQELEEVSIKAVDGLGRIFYEGPIPANQQLSTKDWPAGLFFITLQIGKEQWNKKWIKIR